MKTVKDSVIGTMIKDKRNASNRRFTTRRKFIKETALFAAMLSGPVNAASPWSGRKVALFVLANLKTLQFISNEAARRGLHFQLGLWGHNYKCSNSPDVNHLIDGLNKENHATYCRDAVRTLLQACPAISGITFRAHYESGIPDGFFGFWGTVFQGVAECGRRVEIDLHGKGISLDQVKMALDTGQPVRVTPKLTAEHQGLPAHQAAMRKREDLDSLRDAVYFYRNARRAWAGIVERTRGVYVDKLDFGARREIRGHWADRLPNIDKDLSYIEQILEDKAEQSSLNIEVPSPAAALWLKSRPAVPICKHSFPIQFHPGKPLDIARSTTGQVKVVKLHYRHVNQMEAYVVKTMGEYDGSWRHTIPGEYTDSAFPLMYFFELQDAAGHAWLYPGFEADFANQPYFAVRQASLLTNHKTRRVYECKHAYYQSILSVAYPQRDVFRCFGWVDFAKCQSLPRAGRHRAFQCFRRVSGGQRRSSV